MVVTGSRNIRLSLCAGQLAMTPSVNLCVLCGAQPHPWTLTLFWLEQTHSNYLLATECSIPSPRFTLDVPVGIPIDQFYDIVGPLGFNERFNDRLLVRLECGHLSFPVIQISGTSHVRLLSLGHLTFCNDRLVRFAFFQSDASRVGFYS